VGSKLGVILSLFFAIFVFIFACDLITLQANYSNLESIANSVSLLISESGGANLARVNLIISNSPGVRIKYDNTYFKVGEFKEFTLLKQHQGVLIFQDPIDISVSRTVLVGQFERTEI
jgi:hypothetical protein